MRHGWNEDDCECAQNLSHEVCGVIIKLWNNDARAVSVHVRHASVEVQVHCVNVVIGVVLGELHVLHITLVLIAFTVANVFIAAILRRILLYWRYSVYRFSTEANFYLSEPDLPIDLLGVVEIAEIQILD